MDENCDFSGGGWDCDDDDDGVDEVVEVALAKAIYEGVCCCDRAIGGKDEDGCCFSCGFEVA